MTADETGRETPHGAAPPRDATSHETHAHHARDWGIAVRNAAMLGSSLIGTWGVALLVRIYLPRYLGPEVFGAFNYADNLAASCFSFLSLGIDGYVQKELPARPQHASDFFGGLYVVRAALSVFIFAGMLALLYAGHRPVELVRTALIFGLAQFLVSVNANYAALLHASRTVGRLSVLNVASKVVWAAAVLVAVLLRGGLEWLAAALVLSELVKTIALARLVRKLLHLDLRLDWRGTLEALRGAAPFYLNAVAIVVYAKIDINIMAFLISDKEIGWYSAAQNFAGLAMLIAPLMSWVLMPQLSRAAARSSDELMLLMRRAIEGVMALAIPVSLLMGVGADVWVHYAFGPSYAPAVASLRILGPMFVVTYLAMLGATALFLLNRGWTVTATSTAGLIANAVLNLVFTGRAWHKLGDGGGGLSASIISVVTELAVGVFFLAVLGRRVFDRRNVASIGKSLFAYALVVVLDPFLRRLGPARLLLDLALYAAIVLGSGAIKISEVAALVRSAIQERRGAHANA